MNVKGNGTGMSTAEKSKPDSAPNTVDTAEVARFSAMAAEWWDPRGKFRPLHKFNPVRLAYIKAKVASHYGCDAASMKPFGGLRFLDIGCGGGLLSEPMCRLGATMVSADASAENIATASIHAREQGLDIDYRATTAEALMAAGEKFDVILNMEVIEHVADRDAFLQCCAAMLKPGGIMFVATLNRTLKAMGLAIIGAEYILRWLPRGTHDWSKFITPDEMKAGLAASGLTLEELVGVGYNPLTDRWSLGKDTDVNYMMLASKPADS